MMQRLRNIWRRARGCTHADTYSVPFVGGILNRAGEEDYTVTYCKHCSLALKVEIDS